MYGPRSSPQELPQTNPPPMSFSRGKNKKNKQQPDLRPQPSKRQLPTETMTENNTQCPNATEAGPCADKSDKPRIPPGAEAADMKDRQICPPQSNGQRRASMPQLPLHTPALRTSPPPTSFQPSLPSASQDDDEQQHTMPESNRAALVQTNQTSHEYYLAPQQPT
jgi:hypothetical protein